MKTIGKMPTNLSLPNFHQRIFSYRGGMVHSFVYVFMCFSIYVYIYLFFRFIETLLLSLLLFVDMISADIS